MQVSAGGRASSNCAWRRIWSTKLHTHLLCSLHAGPREGNDTAQHCAQKDFDVIHSGKHADQQGANPGTCVLEHVA